MKRTSINQISLNSRIKTYLRNPFSLLMLLAVTLAVLITVVVLVYIVGYILVKGVPYLTPSLFEFVYTSTNVSLFPSIITTLFMVAISLVIAAPIGIFCAIYLVEYAKRGNRFVKYVRITTETLSGIPSIVYGLFGLLFFVMALNMGTSIIAGCLTLSIMILPLIIRTTEEALKSVPDTFREGSYGLGATRLRTVFMVILPSAVPGILAGIILSIGRIVGETAALIYTAGTIAQIPTSLGDSARTLSIHMYSLSRESLHTSEAYATAVVLLIVVLIINFFANVIANKFKRGKL
ncbi:MAG: phosphate ABC transporter permease PstA [Clostridia bacterium]